MKKDEIASELRAFVRNRFGVPESDPDFTDDVDLFDFGYIDSLGAAEVTRFLEDRFGIKFTDADWVTYPLNSIHEISDFVARRNE